MKKILVVSTLYYERLEGVIDDLADVLAKENPKEKYEFYIVNENYGRKLSINVKFNNYICTHDSTDEDEMCKILECIKKWPKFDFSVQTDEYAITILAIINSKLGLPGLTLEDEHKFRDKVKMKELLGEDVDKPVLYNLQDIDNNLISYPVVVKPRTFAASRGVCIIDNKEDLLNIIKDKSIEYNRVSIDTIDDLEIEEFIDADIYHIDGLIFNGRVEFCVASKYIGNCFNYAQGNMLGSIKATEIQQKQALNFIKKVNRDLKIPNGAFHLECFYRAKEFVFLEIGARPGGAEVVPAIEAATGINLSKEHVKCQLGIKPFISTEAYKYFGWLNFPYIYNSNNERYVKSVTLPDFTPKSLYSSSIPSIGERATADFVNYGTSLGGFIFLGNNREELEKDMKEYAEKYVVEVE